MTDITPIGPGASAEPETPTASAPASSAMLNFADMRTEVVDDLYTDLKVPRWPVDIYVRYGPVDSDAMAAAQRRMDGRQRKVTGDSLLNENMDMLIKACIGVFYVNGDTDSNGEPKRYSLSPDGPESSWTKFDEKLGEALGIPVRSARAACKGLLVTDGDVFAHSVKLVEFSGFSGEGVDEELTGE